MLKFVLLFLSALVCAVSSQGFDMNSFISQNSLINEMADCFPDSKEGGNENGRCVKTSQCQISVLDQATNFDSREKDGKEDEDSQENQPTINPDKNCGSFLMCCPLSKIKRERTVQKPRPIGCGYSNPGGVAYRESDDKAGYAEYAEFPWMVALMLNKESKTKEDFQRLYLGGGTIIHPSVVLTVAHKLENITSPKQLKCRAGMLSWSEANEIYRTQEREVAKTIIHPEFNRVYIRFDIALLILSTPFDVTSTPNIAVACLEPNFPAFNTECYSMGWGKDFVNGESNAVTLKKIALPLVPREVCQTELRKITETLTLHNSIICAGGEKNVDTCIGDGGSSLVCTIQDPEHARYSVVGLVGYGYGCGTQDLPGVYTNVPLLYNWIVNKMTLEKLDSSLFKYNQPMW